MSRNGAAEKTMTAGRFADSDATFEQYGSTQLYAYPNLSSPTLLFWCTASPLPTNFSIEQAWSQPEDIGYFLFVSDPVTNLSDLSSVSNAMNALSSIPPSGSRGFIWLHVALDTATILVVTAAAAVAADVSFGPFAGTPQLALKHGAPVSPGSDGQSFAFLYPTGIPNASPPSPAAAFPIVLALLGPNAGRFQFTGFQPYHGYYYQYGVVLDPLDPGNSSQSMLDFAIELVPTGQLFPAFAIRVPPQQGP
jgi:hypothetical protein